MGRKKKYPDQNFSGRPPKPPETVLRTPIRAMVTLDMMEAVAQMQERYGITMTEVVRLGLYYALSKHEIVSAEVLNTDETFKSLRERGMV